MFLCVSNVSMCVGVHCVHVHVCVCVRVLYCVYLRLSKSIEGMQCFSLVADPSFRHFQLDVSKELKLLKELQFTQGERPGGEERGSGGEGERGRWGGLVVARVGKSTRKQRTVILYNGMVCSNTITALVVSN